MKTGTLHLLVCFINLYDKIKLLFLAQDTGDAAKVRLLIQKATAFAKKKEINGAQDGVKLTSAVDKNSSSVLQMDKLINSVSLTLN